jgi:hypothetical protein
VLTTVSAQQDTTDRLKSADLTRVTSSGSETAVTVEERPAATALAGTSQQGELASSSIQVAETASAVPPAPVATSGVQSTVSSEPAKQANAATSAPGRTRLPQTASSIPIAMLLGTAMVGAGVMLSWWPRLRV